MTDINDACADYNVSDSNETEHIAAGKINAAKNSVGESATEQNTQRKVKREDLKEPTKPLSAFSLFFRDTVIAIKEKNPNTTFKELTRVVCSMWDILDPVHKDVYARKYQTSLKQYYSELQTYRQQLAQIETKEEEEEVSREQLMVRKKSVPVVVKIIPMKKTMSETQPKHIVIKQCDNQSQTIQLQPKQIAAATPSSASNPTNNANGIVEDNNAASKEALKEQSAAANLNVNVNDGNPMQKCTREECGNLAVVNPDWEDEYCSNECVINHCRNVFNTWVQSNLTAQQQNNKT